MKSLTFLLLVLLASRGVFAAGRFSKVEDAEAESMPNRKLLAVCVPNLAKALPFRLACSINNKTVCACPTDYTCKVGTDPNTGQVIGSTGNTYCIPDAGFVWPDCVPNPAKSVPFQMACVVNGRTACVCPADYSCTVGLRLNGLPIGSATNTYCLPDPPLDECGPTDMCVVNFIEMCECPDGYSCFGATPDSGNRACQEDLV